MTAMKMVAEVRRLVQDPEPRHWTDAEIITLISLSRQRLFMPSPWELSPEQEEAVVIVVAFKLLQARDAALQLEALAVVQP